MRASQGTPHILRLQLVTLYREDIKESLKHQKSVLCCAR